MKHSRRSVNKYDKVLWNLVWENAKEVAQVNDWEENAAILQLCEDSKVSESVVRRHKAGTESNLSPKNRERFAQYLKHSNFDAFVCWWDEQELKKGSIYSRVKEIIKDNSFLERIYAALSDSLFSGNEIHTEKLTADEALLYLKLIRSLHEFYLTENSFTRIKLVADENYSLGSLDMKDYFIQLSYVPRQEAITRESVIRDETELNKIKLRRALETNQLLSKDYISNYNLQSIHNLLIIGSPGIGKSTFSRWLCHMWAQESLSTGTMVPIYIPLKSLNFENHENVLIDFINTHYLLLPTTENNTIQAILRKARSSACLILDGYDELSEQHKERLFHNLQAISSDIKYILTSRPYGVLNTYGLKWDQTIQLDGFDMPGIQNYIESFLSKNPTKGIKTREKLIDIINLNPVLTDFAHNPLMLSFIVYIYLFSDDTNDIFASIQTRFDLQQIVINWMITHSKVKTPIYLNETLINKIARVASKMELNKLPTLSYSVNDPELDTVLRPICQIGIAQYSADRIGSCSFYFNSITFQEYFASVDISGGITIKAFEYLIQDYYFWNLAAMLIGQLSAGSSSGMINELLISCEKELEKSETDHGYYKFLLLLSECRLDYFKKIITTERIQKVYKAYRDNFNNEKFKYAITECIQHIYNKLIPAHQRYFKDLIYNDIEQSWESSATHLNKWNNTCSHIPFLYQCLNLQADYLFIKKCLDLLVLILQAISEDDDNTVIWGFPDLILNIIEDYPEPFFQVYKTELIRISMLIPRSHAYFKAHIEMHYTNAAQAMPTFSESISILTKKGTVDREETIPGLVVAAFIISKRRHELPSTEVVKYKQLLSKAIVIVRDYILSEQKKNYDTLYITGPQPYTRLIVESIFELEYDFELYTDAVDLVAGYGDEYLYFDRITESKFYTYFDIVIKNTISLSKEERLAKICSMIFGIPPLKSKISIYRNEIVKAVLEYVDENSVQFEKLAPSNKVMPFFYLLEREDGAIYEPDRRFLVAKILEHGLGDLPYFRQMLFPSVFTKHLSFFETLHWEYILSYLDKKDIKSIWSVLSIYTNPVIYKYTANISYIERLLAFLLKVREQLYYPDLIKKATYHILTIVGYILRMVVDENVSSTERNRIMAITEELLKQDLIKSEAKQNLSKYTGRVSACSAFILQYYLTENEEVDLKINYWKELEKDGARVQLVEFVYSALVSNGILPEDVRKLKNIAGPAFIKALHNYHDNMKVYYTPFEVDKFKTLCA